MISSMYMSNMETNNNSHSSNNLVDPPSDEGFVTIHNDNVTIHVTIHNNPSD